MGHTNTIAVRLVCTVTSLVNLDLLAKE